MYRMGFPLLIECLWLSNSCSFSNSQQVPVRFNVQPSLHNSSVPGLSSVLFFPLCCVFTALTKLRFAGFTLFLGFIIDRMHHYLTKLIRIRSKAGSSKEELEELQKEKLLLKEKEEKASKEMKRLQKELSAASENLKKLKLECEEKEKKIETAEAHVTALQKQSADLLLEYDRLLEDNQNLQAQGYKS